MKKFAELYRNIDSTTRTKLKIQALVNYFKLVSDKDKLWAIALFTHRRPRRTIQLSFLRSWAAEQSQIPEWLFEESYHIAGDLAETISLVLPLAIHPSDKSLSEWIQFIKDQKVKDVEEKKSFVLSAWSSLTKDECFLFNKIITGGFRIGVSQKLIVRALSIYLEEDQNKVSHRLMGDWSPDDITFEELLIGENWKDDLSKPYPFYLAYPLDDDLSDLGSPGEWSAEWKWDGIRVQIIKRKGELFIWTRGEELVTKKYPEFGRLKGLLPDNFVIDGELVIYKDSKVGTFNALQKRIGRKTVGKKLLDSHPVVIMSYDLLEYRGKDIRQKKIEDRRSILHSLIHSELANNGVLYYSESLKYNTWEDLKVLRDQARINGAEGLMLKHIQGNYKIGRHRGDWWKWKLDPFTIDAVMLYAQRGHGRRSNLFTDFTFAVWNEGGTLVPFAKAYSGLTDKEFMEITSFVNKNTIERFGPVRSVSPELVFELAFEGINLSPRHKSGVALRFPRILRWRKDKPASAANTLDELKSLLTAYEGKS